MKYDNTNSGIVWVNDYAKEKNHPSYKGKGNFNGVDFEVAMWERLDNEGRTIFSIKFSEPYKKQQDAPQPKPQPTPDFELADVQDDLPF